MTNNHYKNIMDALEDRIVDEFNEVYEESVYKAEYSNPRHEDGKRDTRLIVAPRFILPDKPEDYELPMAFFGYGGSVYNPAVQTPGANYRGETFTVVMYVLLCETPDGDATAQTGSFEVATPLADVLPTDRNIIQCLKPITEQAAEAQNAIHSVIRKNQKIGDITRLSDSVRQDGVLYPIEQEFGTSAVRLANVRTYEGKLSSREFLQFDIAVDIYYPASMPFEPENDMM